MTGFQTSIGKLQNPFVAPEDGEIVAWSLKQGKPRKADRRAFNEEFGPPKARIGILRRSRGPAARRATSCCARARSRTSARSSASTTTFSLDAPLAIRQGEIVALTIKSWAPAFAVGQGAASEWMASRRSTQQARRLHRRRGPRQRRRRRPADQEGHPAPLRLRLRPRPAALLGDVPADSRRSGYPQAAGFSLQACSKASSGEPGSGGLSFVAESSWLGSKLPVPVPPVPPVCGFGRASSRSAVVSVGAVVAVVLDRDRRQRHLVPRRRRSRSRPAPRRPRAASASSRAVARAPRLTNPRREPTGEGRSTDSR